MYCRRVRYTYKCALHCRLLDEQYSLYLLLKIEYVLQYIPTMPMHRKDVDVIVSRERRVQFSRVFLKGKTSLACLWFTWVCASMANLLSAQHFREMEGSSKAEKNLLSATVHWCSFPEFSGAHLGHDDCRRKDQLFFKVISNISN